MLPAVAGKLQPLFRALPTLRPSSRPFSTSLPALMDPWAITKDVGGEANVRRLEAIARDFRSAYCSRLPPVLSSCTKLTGSPWCAAAADTITVPRCEGS